MGKDHLAGVLGELCLQQPVNGGRRRAGELLQPLGRPAGGRRQHCGELHPLKERQHAVDRRALARTRPAGEDHHPAHSRHRDGLPLALGVFDADRLRRLLQQRLQSGRPVRRQPEHLMQPLLHILLRLIEFRQIAGCELPQRIQNHPLLRRQLFQGDLNGVPVQTQKRHRGLHQLLGGQEGMSISQVVPQLKQDARRHPPQVRTVQAQLQSEGVDLFKRRVEGRFCQQVGIFPDGVHGLLAIGPVEPQGQLHRQAVGAEVFHQPAHAQLAAEALADLQRLFPGDAGNHSQLLRHALEYVQRLCVEQGDNLLGRLGADAPDGAGGEVGQNLLLRLGHELFEHLCAELRPIGRMRAPGAGDHQMLSHCDLGHLSHNRGSAAILTPEPEHGVARLIALKHHRGHGAAQNVLLFQPHCPFSSTSGSCSAVQISTS